LEWELSTGLLNDNEDSERFVGDNGGGGRLELPAGLLKVSVKEGTPVGFVKLKVGFVNEKLREKSSARLSATGAAFKRLRRHQYLSKA
jgi:hypothetical protein